MPPLTLPTTVITGPRQPKRALIARVWITVIALTSSLTVLALDGWVLLRGAAGELLPMLLVMNLSYLLAYVVLFISNVLGLKALNQQFYIKIASNLAAIAKWLVITIIVSILIFASLALALVADNMLSAGMKFANFFLIQTTLLVAVTAWTSWAFKVAVLEELARPTT